jgi:hypothetical protein
VNPIVITKDNGNEYFRIEWLTAGVPLDTFECRFGEYTDYLRDEALRAQADHLSLINIALITFACLALFFRFFHAIVTP